MFPNGSGEFVGYIDGQNLTTLFKVTTYFKGVLSLKIRFQKRIYRT
jgi:hypothetical protein